MTMTLYCILRFSTRLQIDLLFSIDTLEIHIDQPVGLQHSNSLANIVWTAQFIPMDNTNVFAFPQGLILGINFPEAEVQTRHGTKIAISQLHYSHRGLTNQFLGLTLPYPL
jgi:hypothetical protein